MPNGGVLKIAFGDGDELCGFDRNLLAHTYRQRGFRADLILDPFLDRILQMSLVPFSSGMQTIAAPARAAARCSRRARI